MLSILKRVFLFYKEGFQRLEVGKTLWCIVLIKLVILFGVFRVFLFNDRLETHFDTDEQISQHVLNELTNISIEDKR